MEDIFLVVGETIGQAGMLGFFMCVVGKLINIVGKALTRGEIIV